MMLNLLISSTFSKFSILLCLKVSQSSPDIFVIKFVTLPNISYPLNSDDDDDDYYNSHSHYNFNVTAKPTKQAIN